MFNFFDEIKSKIGLRSDALYDYNIVNISGKMLYVEGHKGVTILTSDMIAFKIKKGRVVIDGSAMTLAELTDDTMLVEGNIKRVEVF